jgi:hypothetical protein
MCQFFSWISRSRLLITTKEHHQEKDREKKIGNTICYHQMKELQSLPNSVKAGVVKNNNVKMVTFRQLVRMLQHNVMAICYIL